MRTHTLRDQSAKEDAAKRGEGERMCAPFLSLREYPLHWVKFAILISLGARFEYKVLICDSSLHGRRSGLHDANVRGGECGEGGGWPPPPLPPPWRETMNKTIIIRFLWLETCHPFRAQRRQ